MMGAEQMAMGRAEPLRRPSRGPVQRCSGPVQTPGAGCWRTPWWANCHRFHDHRNCHELAADLDAMLESGDRVPHRRAPSVRHPGVPHTTAGPAQPARASWMSAFSRKASSPRLGQRWVNSRSTGGWVRARRHHLVSVAPHSRAVMCWSTEMCRAPSRPASQTSIGKSQRRSGGQVSMAAEDAAVNQRPGNGPGQVARTSGPEQQSRTTERPGRRNPSRPRRTPQFSRPAPARGQSSSRCALGRPRWRTR
jgi:hypothetical protein